MTHSHYYITGLAVFKPSILEQVGLIYGMPNGYDHEDNTFWSNLRVVKVPNVSKKPWKQFQVTANDLALSNQEVKSRGTNFRHCGYFHTHGLSFRTTPSQRDREMASLDITLIYALYNPFSRELVWYTGDGSDAMPMME